MSIVGRAAEQRLLEECYESERPVFLIVYGRRRVGKTSLVREVFKKRFCSPSKNARSMRPLLRITERTIFSRAQGALGMATFF
jgi:Cdc6-like AAA superfamily ATPase